MTDLLDRLKAAIGDTYTIEGELGTGGMGTVYRVRVRDSGERIALKTLHRIDTPAIHRFKREFRALADVAHENLIQLYELAGTDDVWFFTMELVTGLDFIEYVRPGPPAGGHDDVTEVYPIDAGSGLSETGAGSAPPDAGILDETRLRSALHQLFQGVAALHRAGKVHRDLKPSNVLVTDSGLVRNPQC